MFIFRVYLKDSNCENQQFQAFLQLTSTRAEAMTFKREAVNMVLGSRDVGGLRRRWPHLMEHLGICLVLFKPLDFCGKILMFG